MAAITPVVTAQSFRGVGLESKAGALISGASASGSGDTLTSAVVRPFRLKRVHVHYAGAGTHSAVTVNVDSILGANYDQTLFTGTANQQDEDYIPDGEGALFAAGDEILVTVPAQTTTISYIVALGACC